MPSVAAAEGSERTVAWASGSGSVMTELESVAVAAAGYLGVAPAFELEPELALASESASHAGSEVTSLGAAAVVGPATAAVPAAKALASVSAGEKKSASLLAAVDAEASHRDRSC